MQVIQPKDVASQNKSAGSFDVPLPAKMLEAIDNEAQSYDNHALTIRGSRTPSTTRYYIESLVMQQPSQHCEWIKRQLCLKYSS